MKLDEMKKVVDLSIAFRDAFAEGDIDIQDETDAKIQAMGWYYNPVTDDLSKLEKSK